LKSFLAAVLTLFPAGFILAASANEPPPGTAIVYPGDGARMVYVPAGEFTMGLDEAEANVVAKHLGKKDANELWAWDCYPKRRVTVDGFFIDECEVTVARWKRFVEATGHKSKSAETSQHFDKPAEQQLPAGEILWNEAKDYAKWAGKSLPTDAQWEKAARGTDGRLYPWGNDPPSTDRGHFGEEGKRPMLYVPVGSFPRGASPYGALDMLGNQYEWTADWLEPYPGNPLAEKMGDYSGQKAVSLRGGSWYHGWVSFYAAKRFGLEPGETYYHVGFRTVWKPPTGYFGSAQFEKDKAAASAK
jgi:formylglycine-generating enzyme required for sulfatase activity